jgi:branched-chain amino acid transport system permease protein
LFASVAFLVFAYLGGIASVWGAVFGGLVVTGGLLSTALFEWFDIDTKYTLLVAGLAVVVATIKSPEGIAGVASSRTRRTGPATAREAGRGDGDPERPSATERVDSSISSAHAEVEQ